MIIAKGTYTAGIAIRPDTTRTTTASGNGSTPVTSRVKSAATTAQRLCFFTVF